MCLYAVRIDLFVHRIYLQSLHIGKHSEHEMLSRDGEKYCTERNIDFKHDRSEMENGDCLYLRAFKNFQQP